MSNFENLCLKILYKVQMEKILTKMEKIFTLLRRESSRNTIVASFLIEEGDHGDPV